MTGVCCHGNSVDDAFSQPLVTGSDGADRLMSTEGRCCSSGAPPPRLCSAASARRGVLRALFVGCVDSTPPLNRSLMHQTEEPIHNRSGTKAGFKPSSRDRPDGPRLTRRRGGPESRGHHGWTSAVSGGLLKTRTGGGTGPAGNKVMSEVQPGEGTGSSPPRSGPGSALLVASVLDLVDPPGVPF